MATINRIVEHWRSAKEKARRREAMLEQDMHAGNTDAKFDPPPEPKTVKLKSKDGCAECEVPEKYVAALLSSGKWASVEEFSGAVGTAGKP